MQPEISRLQDALKIEKARTADLWKTNCEQLSEFDATLLAKDEEISKLKEEFARSHTHHSTPVPVDRDPEDPVPLERPAVIPQTRRGKAPPVDPFTGEDPEMRLDDWLPALQRASNWNG